VSEAGAGLQDWRRFSPEELARQYSPRGTVNNLDALLQDYRTQSQPMYDLPHLRDLRYGPQADELLDLFPVPGRTDAPLFVFIHGGYWRALGKQDSVFMARNFTAHGVAVAAVNYQLAPAARLSEIVAQCRRSLAWLYTHGPAHGIDVRRIVLGGSSAGAHLAAMLLAPGWQAAFGLPPDVVKAGVLVSGLYDLAPVQQTTPNDWLALDSVEAAALSPQSCLPDAGARLCIATAEKDTDEFKRQSLDYAAACTRQGCAVQYAEIAGRNHFDVIMDWMNPQALLTKSTWDLLAPA
jgi:arylformamidase